MHILVQREGTCRKSMGYKCKKFAEFWHGILSLLFGYISARGLAFAVWQYPTNMGWLDTGHCMLCGANEGNILPVQVEALRLVNMAIQRKANLIPMCCKEG